MKKVKEDLVTYTRINEEEKKRPLLPKSAILKILAEAVRSYSGCAKLIADHSYCAGQSEMVTEVRHRLNFEMKLKYCKLIVCSFAIAIKIPFCSLP
jgi:hypothetical protein